MGFAKRVPFGAIFCPSGGSFSGSYKAQKNAQKGRYCLGLGLFWGCYRGVITVCGILRLKKDFFNYAIYTVNYGILYISFYRAFL